MNLMTKSVGLLAATGLVFGAAVLATPAAQAATTPAPAVTTIHIGSTTITGTVQLLPTPHAVTLRNQEHSRTVANLSACGHVSVANAYAITNLNSGKVLEVFHSSTSDYANVDQWSYNGSATQLWVLCKVGTLNGYDIDELVNANSNKCAEVYHSQTTDGANVDQYTCNGTGTQYWIDYETYGDLVFANLTSGKVLEVFHSQTTDGANVDQWAFNDTLTQDWD